MLIVFLSITLHASQPTSAPSRQTTISTVQEALFNMRRIITHFSTLGFVVTPEYEQKSSIVMLKCARVLYDNARVQILETLQEIDNRLAYWRYQKNHPWRYFVSKNPLKWVAGVPQDLEIENNIEQLESHQGELYVILGQLAQLGNVYDNEHKMSFVSDYTKGYEWIDQLLATLARIKVITRSTGEQSPFIVRANALKAKLEKVRTFKTVFLSEIQDTQMPAHIAQNWLKYGALMFLFGQGYSRADQVRDLAATSFEQSSNYLGKAYTSVRDVFFPAYATSAKLLVPQENIEEAKRAIKEFINNLSVKEDHWRGAGDIKREDKQHILATIETGDSGALQKLMNDLWNAGILSKGKSLSAIYLFSQFEVLQMGKRLQEQFAGISNIAFLTPAFLTGWLAYSGYKKLAVKDYSPIRLALVEINSLFVDQTKPLNDEQYGKMIYLLYQLKQQAAKVVPLNFRVDFLQDLEKIELKEFNVAAKRAIVEDMFKKYSFLGMVQ